MKARTRSARASGTDPSTQNNAEFVSVPLVTEHYFDSLLSPRQRAKASRKRRRYLAFHEAGHVVAAVRLGIPLKERAAELLTEPQSGFTHFISDIVDFDGSREARGRIEELIVFLLAGCAATKWLNQDYERGSGLSSGDFDRAKKLIETITASSGPDLPWDPYGWGSYSAVGYVTEYYAYLRMLEYRSERLIAAQENWELVVRIASVLLSRNYITRTKVLSMVPMAASRKRGKKAN